MPSARPRAAFAMSEDAAAALLTPSFLASLKETCELAHDPELLITSWGCPPLTPSVLAGLPSLRAVVHIAGSVQNHITEACWERGIEVCSAAAANALPVAEYTLAMILLGGKRVLERVGTGRPDAWLDIPAETGNYGRTVGILSASMIGRRVVELLQPFDLRVLLHDPYVTGLPGAELVTLPELFAGSDIVSLHAPLLPTTRGLVGAGLIASMRPGALLVNTARGGLVDHDALTEAVVAGRIRAILDVTEPEVLPADHPLWTHATITPHLAGAQGNELRRLSDLALTEITRWSGGAGFARPIHREQLAYLA